MTSSGRGSEADKRKDRRIPLVQEIECKGEAAFRKRLSDISVGGCFIDSLTEFAPGTVINIKFRLPDSDDAIEVMASVRYVQRNMGAGIQFLHLGPKEIDRLKTFVGGLSTQRKPVTRDLRRGSRIVVHIPVTLMGVDSDGMEFKEKSLIDSLAKNGAHIQTGRNLEAGMPVFLRTPDGSKFEARVVWVGPEEVGIQCRGLAQSLGFNFP